MGDRKRNDQAADVITTPAFDANDAEMIEKDVSGALSPAEQAPETETEESVSGETEEETGEEYSACKALGPQSVLAHLGQLLLASVPLIGAPVSALWVFFGGTAASVALVSVPSALSLAVMAFWACGGCANVNRRRFARAYFIWIVVAAALLALTGFLAVSFGFRFSPVLKRLLVF